MEHHLIFKEKMSVKMQQNILFYIVSFDLEYYFNMINE